MNIKLDDTIVAKSKYTLEEVLALVTVKCGYIPGECLQSLINKGCIVQDLLGKAVLSNAVAKDIQDIILDSEKVKQDEELLDLAKRMIALFPKGSKAGSTQWRGSSKDIERRLRIFFKRYEQYSYEDIYNATKQYVSSFNGDYTYMRTLKYFIWKDARKLDEDGNTYVESSSDLANWIENNGDTTQLSNNWTSHIV